MQVSSLPWILQAGLFEAHQRALGRRDNYYRRLPSGDWITGSRISEPASPL
jgi:hypothetical protein